MLNIPPVCWAGGGAYVAVQPVVLKLRWDLVAAISDLWVDRWCLGSAQHPPCQARPDRNHTCNRTGLEPDQNWIEPDRIRFRPGFRSSSDPGPIWFQCGCDPVLRLIQPAYRTPLLERKPSILSSTASCTTLYSHPWACPIRTLARTSALNGGYTWPQKKWIWIQRNTKRSLEHRLWHHYLDPEKPTTFAATL